MFTELSFHIANQPIAIFQERISKHARQTTKNPGHSGVKEELVKLPILHHKKGNLACSLVRSHRRINRNQKKSKSSSLWA